MKKNKEFRNIIERIPYSTISIDYQNIFSIVKKADDFEKVIDTRMKRLESQNINLSACSEYFENMVDDHITKLLSELETEHLKNMHVIGYLFRKRAADKMEFQQLLERIEAEINSTQAEYEVLEKYIEKIDPLKNGKLEAESVKILQEEDDQDE